MVKRKRRKRGISISNILICLGLIILIFLIVFEISNSKELREKLFNLYNNVENKNTSNEEIEIEPKEESYQVTMIMAGDNLIHSSVYKDAYLGNNSYDFRKMYDLIKPIVSQYDIAYYNQETILGGKELGVSNYPTFNSPQEVGDAMIDAGFNLVSLATNHTMDSGERATLASREYWNSRENVLAVGSYSSFEERNNILVREVNNVSYTMLNYTYGTNGMPVPKGKEYLVNVWPTDLYINDVNRDTKYQEYKEQVKNDIESVRDKVDVLIVAMHWGVEYTHEPTAYQKDMAQYLASLDVDIVVGTHPHVIQPITWIDDTLVIYSLGNLISAQYQDANYNKMVGLMTSLEINKTVKGDSVSITIDNIDNELIYTYYKNWRNFKVVPFSNPVIKDYLPNYNSVYNRYKEIVQRYDSNISVKDLSE